MNESDMKTSLHLAHTWNIERSVAQKRAKRWAKKLGISEMAARSPNGQRVSAYSGSDGERIIDAYNKREERRKAKIASKNKRKENLEYEIGTSSRADVITTNEIAKRLGITRKYASTVARRIENQIDIERIAARGGRSQKIIAYRKSDGERLIKFFKDKHASKIARQQEKERLKREREKIPQPPAPSAREELIYLIHLNGKLYKIGWTSDLNQRKKSHQTTNPDLLLIKQWPCKKKWDNKVMTHVFLFKGLERKGKETFNTEDIQAVVSYIDQFFETTNTLK
jgi:predicted GIY-YIG superfamily endonuclease